MSKFGGLCECGNHAWAKLTRGYVTLVSPEDAHIIRNQDYFVLVRPRHKVRYALRTIEKPTRRSAYLHLDILGDAPRTDHTNRNGLDNRRPNLRPCDRSLNAANIDTPAHNSTGYKGVSRRRGRFRASIKKDQKAIEIGPYDTAEDAARAYDRRALELFGPYAKLNFPAEHGWPADHPER